MISCTFENNSNALLRHVTVVAIVVNDKKEFLLVKRAPRMLRGDTYTIPGGFLDRGETVGQGVLRELKEETGLKEEHATLFRINSNPNRPKEDRQNVDFIFIVKAHSTEVKTDSESIEIGWFREEDIPSDSEFAFDHRESIELYLEFLKKPFPLPILV